MKLIDKDALVAEIEERIKKYASIDVGDIEIYEALYGAKCKTLIEILRFLDTLKVKEVDWEEKFVSLQHIDDDRSHTCIDWGYSPNLYHFDGAWHVSWIHCNEGDTFMDFNGETIGEAVKKASDWFHSTFSNC